MSTGSQTLPIGAIGARRRWPETVDDITVRLVAAVVLAIVVVTVATQWWWLFVPLFADFLARTLFGPRWGFTSQLVARTIRPRVGAAPRPKASAPKRFAAGIGAVMTGVASLAWVAGLASGASWPGVALWVIGAVMVLFPALEGVFGLCVGCKLFGLLARLGVVNPDLCVDCA
ncbi:DUF4395 domain-containing protein [Aestuariimicrobium soli]|uniref:DUF4395 domain-containing protein n=1 Tax=Aestuariimicrobium soli TaxID=2035834 RepID=UPI003EB7CC15